MTSSPEYPRASSTYLQPVEEEGLRGALRLVGGLLQGPLAVHGRGEERLQVGGALARLRPPEVERRAHRTLPGAPQAVGVAAAGGALAEAEVTGEGVDLVGEGDGGEDARLPIGAGEGSGGLRLGLDRDRMVVPAHRGGHLLRRALAREVDPAHHPLKLRELADHESDEVRLREPRRLPRRRQRVTAEETLRAP